MRSLLLTLYDHMLLLFARSTKLAVCTIYITTCWIFNAGTSFRHFKIKRQLDQQRQETSYIIQAVRGNDIYFNDGDITFIALGFRIWMWRRGTYQSIHFGSILITVFCRPQIVKARLLGVLCHNKNVFIKCDKGPNKYSWTYCFSTLLLNTVLQVHINVFVGYGPQGLYI